MEWRGYLECYRLHGILLSTCAWKWNGSDIWNVTSYMEFSCSTCALYAHQLLVPLCGNGKPLFLTCHMDVFFFCPLRQWSPLHIALK